VGIAGKAIPPAAGRVFAQRNYRTTHGISAARSSNPFATARDVTKPTVLRRSQGSFGDPHLQKRPFEPQWRTSRPALQR
jgi:hypothetical protein